MVPLQDSYMQSRAEALQNVKSTIHELGSIFNQLATIVSQQGEVAIRRKRYMDATTLVQKFGKPDLILTMTLVLKGDGISKYFVLQGQHRELLITPTRESND